MALVVGVFESFGHAEDAVADLVASGYSHHDIRVLVRDSEDPHAVDVGGRQDDRGPDTKWAVAASLESVGLDSAAAEFFADAICNGAVLIAVHCAAQRAWNARDILEVYRDSSIGRQVPAPLH